VVAARALTGEIYAEAALAERARRAKKANILVAIFTNSLLMVFSVFMFALAMGDELAYDMGHIYRM
jgi:hypothetical protein